MKLFLPLGFGFSLKLNLGPILLSIRQLNFFGRGFKAEATNYQHRLIRRFLNGLALTITLIYMYFFNNSDGAWKMFSMEEVEREN